MASTDIAPASMSGANAAQANMAFIVAIVAVATIGGFMFGYDSGVINGTQDGLNEAFGLSKLGSASRSARSCSAARSARSSPVGWPTGSAAAASW